MEKRVDECKQRGITRQPQVLVLRDDQLGRLGRSNAFVIIENLTYPIDSVVKAIDVCFKAFFVFNAEYPKEALDPWTFIQKGVYDIVTVYDEESARVKEVLAAACY